MGSHFATASQWEHNSTYASYLSVSVNSYASSSRILSTYAVKSLGDVPNSVASWTFTTVATYTGATQIFLSNLSAPSYTTTVMHARWENEYRVMAFLTESIEATFDATYVISGNSMSQSTVPRAGRQKRGKGAFLQADKREGLGRHGGREPIKTMNGSQNTRRHVRGERG